MQWVVRIRGTAFVLALLLVGISCISQQSAITIDGAIQDMSGAAISGAIVTVRQGRLTFTTTTSADGKFSINGINDAPAELTVEAPGFHTERKSLPAASTAITITLKPESVSTEIVVTGNRGPLSLDEAPASVQVIDSLQIQSSGALEVDDVLRQTAGFDLFRRTSSRTANPTTEGISLRGVGSSGASRALVLLDGVPVVDPFGGWMNWSQLPRQSIERVEMVRGGASDLYGSGALSGVVQILTRKPEGTDADLDLSYGSERTPNVSGYLGHAFGQWLASGAGEYFRTSGYVPVERSQRGAVDNPANSLHRNGELQLERQISQRSRFFVRALAYDDSRHNGTILEINRTRAWTTAAGIDLESTAGDLFQIRGYGGTEDYHQTFASVAANRNSETLARLQMVPSRDWGFSGQYSRASGTRNTVLGGVDVGGVTGESDDEVFTANKLSSVASGGGHDRTVGVFAEDILRITTRWLLTPVVRFDNWWTLDGFGKNVAIPSPATTFTSFPNRSESSFDPKLATRYQLKGNLGVRASVYRSLRSPTLNELYRSFRLGNTLTLDNPQLRAERLTGWEAGPSERLLGGKLRLDETFFWADVHRPVSNVTLSTTPALITRMRENLGGTRARGVETQLAWSAAKFVDIGAQYQFVDATVTSFPANPALVGRRVPEVPHHEFTFQASYSNPRLFTIALQGRTTSSVFDDDINSLILGSYFKFDAYVSRRLTSAADIYVAGENLLNQQYAVARSPIVTTGPPLLARVGLQIHLRK